MGGGAASTEFPSSAHMQAKQILLLVEKVSLLRVYTILYRTIKLL